MFLQGLAGRIAPLFTSPIRRTIAERLHVIEEQIGFADFNMERFRDWVADLNRRPILFQPLAMHPSYSGAWVRTTTVDIIYFEERTSPLHQAHIQLHELCHILLLHNTFTVYSAGELDLVQTVLMHGADVSFLEGSLPLRLRSVRSSAEEREAEGLASVLHQRVLRTRMAPVTDGPVSSSDALLRMYRSMGWT
jgi:hypothetical protein